MRRAIGQVINIKSYMSKGDKSNMAQTQAVALEEEKKMTAMSESFKQLVQRDPFLSRQMTLKEISTMHVPPENDEDLESDIIKHMQYIREKNNELIAAESSDDNS